MTTLETKSMPKSFGEYMYDSRKAKGMSKKKAAEVIGVSENTITN